jgi:hypothetical protein
MASRTAVLGTLVVLLAAGNGFVAYLHWGMDDPQATEDTSPSATIESSDPDTSDSTSDENQSEAGTTDLSEERSGPAWSVPTWPLNTTWIYERETPSNTTLFERRVTTTNATVQGEPAYGVYRPDANLTTFYSKDTINPMLANGSQRQIFNWELEDGASWTLRGSDGAIAEVHASHEENMTTPLGLYDGYKLVADYEDRNLTEVYRYVDQFRWNVQIDTYENGAWQQTLKLVAYQSGS